MSKVFILIVIILMAIASLSGYLILNSRINAGQLNIDDGQKQLDEGQAMLERGKTKLAAGRRKLSQFKRTYNSAGLFSLVGLGAASLLPVAAIVDVAAKSQISEGSKLVAQGAFKVKAGEARLAAGKLELLQGENRLKSVKRIRNTCALAAAFFIFLTIALSYYWRKSLAQIFFREKNNSINGQ